MKGTYLGCKYAIPAMQTSRRRLDHHVSSIAAFRVGSGASDAYTAAKGGIATMTRTLAVEHASTRSASTASFPVRSIHRCPGRSRRTT